MKHIKSIIRLAALLLVMVCAQSVKAQQTYIMVHKVDGTVLRIAVADVDSVTFREWTGPVVSYDYVDMGLKVMWASCNIGATSPEQFGSYFAWGETAQKNEYTEANYKWYDATGAVLKYNIFKSLGSVDMKYRLDADDDAAHVLLGEGWRMPTPADFNDLFMNSEVSLTEQNGVRGLSFTSDINGNSIFLPLAGEFWKGDTIGTSQYAYYSTNTLICSKQNDPGWIYSLYYGERNGKPTYGFSSYNRVGGLPIRPVYSPNTTFDGNVLVVKGIVMGQDSITLKAGEYTWMDAYVDSNDDIYLTPEFTSSDDSVATVDADGKVVAVSAGECIITVSWGDYSATCVVTVNAIVPATNEPVDLGLSVKWGSLNLGAVNEEDFGGFYAWGELTEKEYYYWDSYKWVGENYLFTKYNFYAEDGVVDMKYRLDLEDDVAYKLLGDNWRMPTDEEFEELLYNCSWEVEEVNGVKGFRVTSLLNGNSIFLPLTGEKWGYDHNMKNYAFYSTNTMSVDEGDASYVRAVYMNYNEYGYDNYYLTGYRRSGGLAIRPVYTTDTYENVIEISNLWIEESISIETGESYCINAGFDANSNNYPQLRWKSSDESVATVNSYGTVTGKSQGTCIITASIGNESVQCAVSVTEFVPVMESVDLGLSVEWATCNVGASRPEFTGRMYAWGETETKDEFSRDNYKLWSDSTGYTKYNQIDGKTVLDPDDDVASVQWGDGWRMPTYEEFVELVENCSFEFTDINGLYGLLVTSYINGNSIFLPNHSDYGEPVYWSSTLSKESTAKILYNDSPYYSDDRADGLQIRPVRLSKNYTELTLSDDTLEIYEGQSYTLTGKIYGQELDGDNLTWKSSDESVALVNNGEVTGVAAGTAIITARLDSTKADTCFVTVLGREPFDRLVDLGLSVRWASCNVGASYPEQFGEYYAWGETEPYYTGSYRNPVWKDGKENGYSWYSNKYAVVDSLDNTWLTKYNEFEKIGLDGFVDKKTVLDAADDAASANLGGYWRTPTSAEFKELMDKCNWEWTEMYGVEGYLVTSAIAGYENNSIFLPYSGDFWETEVEEYDGAFYWTSSLYSGTSKAAEYFSLGNIAIDAYYRFVGGSVRPVLGYDLEDVKDLSISRSELPLALNSSYKIEVNALNAAGTVIDVAGGLRTSWTSDDESVATVQDGIVTAVGAGICIITANVRDHSIECLVTVEDPSQAEPESVDLGLSVKWATFNVGSFAPEMIGDFFAWGEVEPYYEAGYAESADPVWKDGKSEGYAWPSYQWAELVDSASGNYTVTKYAKDGKTVLEDADDAAIQAWGGKWRMPDTDEFRELMYLCDWEFVVVNGVKGYRVTSKIDGYTDKSIFLPLTNSRSGSKFNSDSEGYYWSRNVNEGNSITAWYLYIDEGYQSVWNYYRYQGRTVRPVCPSDSWQGITAIDLDSTSISIALGTTDNLTYSIHSGNHDYSFLRPTGWKSSDENVITVDADGTLHPIKEGSATITAYYNELTSECVVTVKKLSEIDPEQALEVYNAMYTQLGKPMSCGYDKPDDYGLIMIAYSTDIEASDMFLPNTGYNWFSVCGELSSRNISYRNGVIRYNACYNVIKAANQVLCSYDENSSNPEVQAKIGEAYAIRAFAYLNLAPYYQVSYTSSAEAKNLLCVPILTPDTPDPSNNPRATLQEVYDLILSDLGTAIEKLDGWKRSDKSRIDQQVAYGLRARAYLNMGLWSQAADDAEAALDGYEPASISDVSTPFLYDLSESNWMWGYDMTEEIADLFSYATSSAWLRSFSGNGYSTGCQTYTMINSDLYDLIPSTDVRKGWWVNENLTSPLLNRLVWDDLKGQEIASEVIGGTKEQFLPYTNVKFGMKYPGNKANDEDWCWMRAEEMILIMVEGLAKSGHAEDASDILTYFVQQYRDPSYDIEGRGLSLEDEIWFQRRVELWGEGFSNNDLRRLNKPLVRFHEYKENNCPAGFRRNMSADNGWWLMRFPTAVINQNPALVNNDGGYQPEDGNDEGLLDGITD